MKPLIGLSVTYTITYMDMNHARLEQRIKIQTHSENMNDLRGDGSFTNL